MPIEQQYENKSRKAVSLMELLIVVVIIAVLNVLLIVYLYIYVGKAKESAAQSELRQISQAFQVYKSRHGCYPDPKTCNGTKCDCCIEEDCDGFGSWHNVSNVLVAEGIIGGGNLLELDPWKNPYYFDANWKDDKGKICTQIMSYGPNGTADLNWSDCQNLWTDSDDEGVSIEIKSQ
ncbi:MAG TPA: hypothetical protein PLF16_01085 [Candidatus Staskawiczbacteria bacterium]|nr:hypothetical protein [Candidatus Staskawiczbacteria bacterium]